MSLTDPGILGDGDTAKLEMKIQADKEAKTLTITDRGIGMSKEDLINQLGTVAQSGTSSFIEAFSEGQDVNLIGQFGVGFYSVYLVADTVTVTSKSNEDGKQWIWESTADSTFSLYEDEGPSLGRGTQITLHLKEDCLEFLEEDRLKGLVKRYSEFINFPIYLYTTKEEEEEVPIDEEEDDDSETTEDDEEDADDTGDEDEDAEISDADDEDEEAPKTKKVKKTVHDWDLVNDAKAIWTRNPSDVTDEEYSAFYKSLSKDFNDPLTHTHFSAEGEVEFKSILYIPKEAPYDLYQDYYKKQANVKLYVRRVMITDEFDELLPKYLGFIKGIVDSDSLPLNVSREMLQQNKVLKVIGKKMTRKALAMIKSLADAEKKDEEDKGEDSESAEAETDQEDVDDKKDEKKISYKEFWDAFGKYIKMGVIEDASNRTRLAKLLRYFTTKSEDEMIGLEDYVANMKDNQKNIYYISGEDKDSLMKSPAVESLLAKDIEVIFMTDSIDEYSLQHLTEFEGKRLINAAREGLKLEEDDKDKKRLELYKEDFKPTIDFMKDKLGKKVEKVAISTHLVSSPCVITSADYGWTAQMEKVMKSQAFADQSKFEFMKSKRNFEINPRHPVIVKLNEMIKDNKDDESLVDAIMSLYTSSMLTSGYSFSPEESIEFADRIGRLVNAGLNVPTDAPLVAEIEVPDEPDEEDEEEAGEDDEEEEVEDAAPKEEL